MVLASPQTINFQRLHMQVQNAVRKIGPKLLVVRRYKEKADKGKKGLLNIGTRQNGAKS